MVGSVVILHFTDTFNLWIICMYRFRMMNKNGVCWMMPAPAGLWVTDRVSALSRFISFALMCVVFFDQICKLIEHFDRPGNELIGWSQSLWANLSPGGGVEETGRLSLHWGTLSSWKGETFEQKQTYFLRNCPFKNGRRVGLNRFVTAVCVYCVREESGVILKCSTHARTPLRWKKPAILQFVSTPPLNLV